MCFCAVEVRQGGCSPRAAIPLIMAAHTSTLSGDDHREYSGEEPQKHDQVERRTCLGGSRQVNEMLLLGRASEIGLMNVMRKGGFVFRRELRKNAPG